MDGSGRRVEDDGEARRLLRDARRIAVLGIKPESHEDQPAHWVAAYLKDAGYEIVPVPVYYPAVSVILGEPVFRSLAKIPGGADLVIVFRRPRDVPQHLDDLLALKPKAVWMQSGIRNEEVAASLVAAGIDVVQDRCAYVEHRASVD